jgi:hypothetical protein
MKKKIKIKQSRTIQEEIENNYYKTIEKMDKVFEKEFGKMCPDFNPTCVQCLVHHTYNNFKKELYYTFIKDNEK